jgi:glutamate-1-semialdehyde aminotransferase/predicted aldo/keto reductase-like oxidoreductase
MNYRRLGRTNLEVSVIAIGTNQLRRVPERQAIATLRRAFELGVNLVNAEPEYEGAYDLIAAALREYDHPERIHLSIQAGGLGGADLERIFEATCETFGRERLDLFGITSISDQEAFGANVWRTGGLVEFLLAKKAEGRIRGIFASDHGSPEQTKVVLERDVFDALMLAYNPLGFHLHTVNAKTVWKFETPPVPIDHYGIEDLPRTARELFPLARAHDVGVMLMKPLAGGLLCSGKAFPGHAWRGDMPGLPPASTILKYLLGHEAVTCVVPGMASVEEVEENASAGTGDLRLDEAETRHVEARTAELTRVLCSRCGQCDDLCSQGLPISYLFRAAYHYLYPTAPFAVSSALQYFRLYPGDACVCDTCPAQTCRCPFGIDIPGELKAIHRKMLELRERGIVPAGDRSAEDWASGRPFSFKVLSREIPASLVAGERVAVRLHVRNTGARPWHHDAERGRSSTALAVYVDGERAQLVHLRQDVHPTQDCHFAFELTAPGESGVHDVWMDLFDDQTGLCSDPGAPAIRQAISVTGGTAPRARRGRRTAPMDTTRARHAIKGALRTLGLLEPARRVRDAWARPAMPAAGVAPGTPPAPSPPAGAYAARYVEHNVPAEGVAGARCVFRVLVENGGTADWHRNPSDGHGAVLALFVDGALAGSGTPGREIVRPAERIMIAVTAQLPADAGPHRLRFEMLISNRLWFSEHGTPPLEVPIELIEAPKSRTDELLDAASRRGTWYFSPGQSIHRSLRDGRPSYPVFAESARGCLVTDVDGREYVDVLMGWGSCLLGHGDERIQAAIVRAATTTGSLVSLPHRLEIEVSEALCAGFPWGDEVLFGKNGSDVTTWAVRLARIATGRTTILFAGYHGWQDWSVGGLGFSATGVPSGGGRQALSLPYGDSDALARAVAAHGGNLAAIMIEPAHVCLGPADTQQMGDGPFLERAQALARQAGALFILDEIMTGFRFRQGSAQAAFGLVPDLTCLGKALANGMPLSALVGRGDLLRKHIGQIMYAPTMKGEVYSFAAALEALRVYRQEDVPGAVWSVGERIRARVNEICAGLGLDATLVGPPYRMNLLFHALAVDGEADVLCRTLLQQELARHGVLSHRGYVIPSRAHDEAAVDRCVSGFAAALATVHAALASGRWMRHLDIPEIGAEERPRSGETPERSA